LDVERQLLKSGYFRLGSISASWQTIICHHAEIGQQETVKPPENRAKEWQMLDNVADIGLYQHP
jgi:hypothetical protein